MAAIQDIDAVHRRIDREVKSLQDNTEARIKETRESIDRETDLKLKLLASEMSKTINSAIWKVIASAGGAVAIVMILKEVIIFLFRGFSGITP